MKNLKVHILYEHGPDLRPHGGSYLRLLRPLRHPLLRDMIAVSHSRFLPKSPVDVIILDRLWRVFDISRESAEGLIQKSSGLCSKLIYAFDDNFEQWVKNINVFSSHFGDVFKLFLDAADGIVVTTHPLFDEFSQKQKNAVVIPNLLDEQLLIPKVFGVGCSNKVRIGYMGTPTHDRDLKIVIPVFQEIHKRYGNKVSFEIVGVLGQDDLRRISEWSDIPVRIISPRATEIEYPLFMLWYTQTINWDIAIAPLDDSPFNSYKSDVKLLDYAAVGAAGVFSDCMAYKNTVSDQENGLLVKNEPQAWLDALTLLIENPGLRDQIRRNANRYLFEKRILANTIHLWMDGINQLFYNG